MQTMQGMQTIQGMQGKWILELCAGIMNAF